MDYRFNEKLNELLAFDKTELVRGNVAAAMKSMGASRGVDMYYFPVDKLRILHGFNPRFDSPSYLAHIRSTADSIKQEGYMVDMPIAGYVEREGDENVVYVTNGQTRARAMMLLKEEGHPIDKIPLIIKPKNTTMKDLNNALKKSAESQQLTPMGIAVLVMRSMAAGNDEEAAAKELGITRPYVRDLILLINASPLIRELVISEKITATLAIQELKANPETAEERLVTAVHYSDKAGRPRTTAKHLKALEEVGEIPTDLPASLPESAAAVPAAGEGHDGVSSEDKGAGTELQEPQNTQEPVFEAPSGRTDEVKDVVAKPKPLVRDSQRESENEHSGLLERLQETLSLDLEPSEILMRVQRIVNEYK